MDFSSPCALLAALFSLFGLSHQQLSNIGTNGPSTVSSIMQEVSSTLSTIGTENVTKQTCYDELGCFDATSPWFSLLRPFPAPMEPKQINTALYLFTRKQPDAFKVTLWPDVDLKGSDYDSKKHTVFITHGFAANSSADWMHDMKSAYLEDVDANVFLVDWGRGAKLINYFQAASNTRIVGAELGRFGKHLIELGQQPKQIHAIGHSLGAHTSGYFGKRMAADNHTIGRITGLDAAQPGFETEDAVVKLTNEDADFVDVLHTDARPFIPFFGFGMLQPVGDIDFYINGGALQPGCYTVEVPQNITSILDIAEIPVETLSKWVSCSHGRSYEYFTWSLKNKDCLFVGRKMSTAENAFKVGTLGTLRLVDPVVSSLRSCSRTNCNIVGLFTPKIPARGSFAVLTNGEPPYCMTKQDETRSLYNSLSLGTLGVFESTLTATADFAKNLNPFART
ncbi:hypothetical protein GE061_014170 [Apolygus lucorum]|uniref:Lipase domain-containing protein n=1 Tax=Apolygus lucorum TaxID=248454 RepID=A0A8S9XQ52_APOLU|nr:hypothetical protein GE061_014170 [Apolygus lucorum]